MSEAVIQKMKLAPFEVRFARRVECDKCSFKHPTMPVCTASKSIIPQIVLAKDSTCPKNKWAS